MVVFLVCVMIVLLSAWNFDIIINNILQCIDDITSIITGHSRSFVVNYYDNSEFPITGISMTAMVPEYNYKTGTFTTLLLNAQKAGSDRSHVCRSSEAPQTYWMQVGMQFDSDNIKIGYTDTINDCKTKFFPISFTSGDTIKFQISINDTTDEWSILVENQSDMNPPHTFHRVIPNSSVLDTSTGETSVWFENSNFSENNWHEGFASDIVVKSAAVQHKDGTWHTWENENKMTLKCDVATTPSQLISGSFVNSPNAIIFNISEIQNKCNL